MPSLYSALCRRVIMPLGDLATRQRVTRYLDHYARAQYWPPERLAAETDRRLRETVRIAHAEVPFYRELWEAHGIGPDDIRTAVDLPRLPVVTKAMLRAAFPAGCTRRTPHPWHDYRTGGSTGTPFVVRADSDTMSRARALMLLRNLLAGCEPGAPCLQTGNAVERGFMLSVKDRLLRVTYVPAFSLTDADLDRYLELIDRRRLVFVAGYAQSLHLLGRRAAEVGFNRRLRAAISWGSQMFDHYREAIRTGLGCEVFDSYGVGEGMQIGAQCGRPDGAYHLFSLHVLTEFCHDGRPVAPGEMGEVLLTRLDAGAMPLIRYAVGDMGIPAATAACGCGRRLPLMQAVVGRTSDIVVTPRGNRLIVEFFIRCFKQAPSIERFQVLQAEPGAIHVKLVPGPGYADEDWERVRAQLLARGDPELRITMEAVAEIPVEASQKYRYVKSSL